LGFLAATDRRGTWLPPRRAPAERAGPVLATPEPPPRRAGQDASIASQDRGAQVVSARLTTLLIHWMDAWSRLQLAAALRNCCRIVQCNVTDSEGATYIPGRLTELNARLQRACDVSAPTDGCARLRSIAYCASRLHSR
jgi:hypothetical protein